MIPYFDLAATWREYRGEVEAAISRVLDSGSVILGPEVEAFEKEFADYVGAGFAVGVGNGTDALTVALRAHGIGDGAEVITVANAGVPPIAAIRACGAVPRLIDVCPDTLLLDPGQLEQALTDRTRAILPVHLYGQPVDLDAVTDFAERHGLIVVEDCAQAHGARYREQHVGTFGAVGCFSFYPTKNLGAFGDGGLCVTNDPEVAQRLRSQRMYGFRGDRYAHEEGLNTRLDEMQAAILRVKLRHLDASISMRRALASRYCEALDAEVLRHPGLTPASEHAYHLFVVEHAARPQLCGALENAGIGYSIHYPVAVHCMEAYRFLAPEGGLPFSEKSAERVLSLPLYPGLGDDSVRRVAEVLNESARKDAEGQS